MILCQHNIPFMLLKISPNLDLLRFYNPVFPSRTLKYVDCTFRMEYDQRIIIQFLHNEEVDAHEITRRLQAQFGDSSYAL
jgi:hypothetical protein